MRARASRGTTLTTPTALQQNGRTQGNEEGKKNVSKKERKINKRARSNAASADSVKRASSLDTGQRPPSSKRQGNKVRTRKRRDRKRGTASGKEEAVFSRAKQLANITREGGRESILAGRSEIQGLLAAQQARRAPPHQRTSAKRKGEEGLGVQVRLQTSPPIKARSG